MTIRNHNFIKTFVATRGQKFGQHGPNVNQFWSLSQYVYTKFELDCMITFLSKASVCVSVRVSVCVYQSLACLHNNSSAVHARITKYAWEMQNTLVKMPIIFGVDRPWPSRSNLSWKSNFTSFELVRTITFHSFLVRITKFGPDMHLSTIKKPIVLGVVQCQI